VSGPAPDPVLEPVEVLLQDYARYLTGQRGLTWSTAEVYVRLVRPFLARHYGPDGSGLAELSAADIAGFVRASAPGRAVAAAKLMVTALRSVRPEVPTPAGTNTVALGRRRLIGCGLAPRTTAKGTGARCCAPAAGRL